uniref:Uncharacterized protein n=1 Tax=Cacopsylla melanoneura TaxID=428564 RepID=A0A8D8QPF1_9HEMI
MIYFLYLCTSMCLKKYIFVVFLLFFYLCILCNKRKSNKIGPQRKWGLLLDVYRPVQVPLGGSQSEFSFRQRDLCRFFPRSLFWEVFGSSVVCCLNNICY